MNERRKIIISTGVNPEESLPTPHFDAEATLTARPVVPLSEQETFQKQYGGYAVHATTPFWKRPALLALVVLSAVGIGVAAGLAIGIYKSRQNAQAPMVSAPTSENPKVAQTVEPPAPQSPRVTVTEQTVETPVEPKDEERERSARNERKDKDEEVTTLVVRDKKRDKKVDDDDDQVLDDRQAERERRRDERRERRRRQREEEAVDVPRGIERAGKEINRIREIFEGRQP